jgi:hypothetical protein
MDTLYTVEMVTTHEGRPVVVLRHGQGRHLALMKIPPGHLAVVQRADQIPNEILACTARLAQYQGPISPKTRRLLAELARRS